MVAELRGVSWLEARDLTPWHPHATSSNRMQCTNPLRRIAGRPDHTEFLFHVHGLFFYVHQPPSQRLGLREPSATAALHGAGGADRVPSTHREARLSTAVPQHVTYLQCAGLWRRCRPCAAQMRSCPSNTSAHAQPRPKSATGCITRVHARRPVLHMSHVCASRAPPPLRLAASLPPCATWI